MAPASSANLPLLALGKSCAFIRQLRFLAHGTRSLLGASRAGYTLGIMIRRFGPIFVFLLASPVVFAQGNPPTPAESEVRDALTKFISAFNNLEWETFRLAFDDSATVFYPRSHTIPGTELVSSNRASGRAEIERNFKLVFQQIRDGKDKAPYMDIQPKDLKIQMFGDCAIATFHLNDKPGFLNRRTIVMTKSKAGWKIVHLHASEVSTTSTHG